MGRGESKARGKAEQGPSCNYSYMAQQTMQCKVSKPNDRRVVSPIPPTPTSLISLFIMID